MQSPGCFGSYWQILKKHLLRNINMVVFVCFMLIESCKVNSNVNKKLIS